VGLASASLAAVKTHSVNSQPTPERDIRLFVGIDIKALWQDEFATVTDYTNQRARLDAPSRPALPTSRLERVQFIHATKLSSNPLEFSEVETEFAKGTAKDLGEWMRRQSALQSYADDQVNILNQGVAASAGKPSGEQVQPDGSVVDFGDPTGDAVQNLNNFTTNFGDLTNPGARAGDSDDWNEGEHDALIIKTSISSPHAVADAYVVGIVRIKTREGGPSDVVFFQEIGSLGPTAKKLHIRKDNMSTGFELVDIDLHVYREGQELVSNQSPKQFALTRDEALEYLALERVSGNRGMTLPAKPAWSLAPSALLASERPGDFDFPLTVHVDAKGHVIKIDETSIVPGRIGEIINDLMFMPAIENGVAVSSQAQVNLRDFFQ
tara:strand:+ start:1465 stop:2604 length:1140 start_codon:yes stop_codon:yes gene_type:complete